MHSRTTNLLIGREKRVFLLALVMRDAMVVWGCGRCPFGPFCLGRPFFLLQSKKKKSPL